MSAAAASASAAAASASAASQLNALSVIYSVYQAQPTILQSFAPVNPASYDNVDDCVYAADASVPKGMHPSLPAMHFGKTDN